MRLEEINKKFIKGFVSLTLRRYVLLAINFITINIILVRILPIETIGIFNIANSFLLFFTFFSDVGLAASIIQKKEITSDDLKTTFTIQQLLAFLIFLLVFFTAPLAASFYKLDIAGMWLIRSLGFVFFLSALKVLPATLLERDLKFPTLVWIEVLEALVFNGLLIFLTFQGFKIDAFSWAAIARGITGIIAIYVVSPWKISLGFSKESAKSLLNFGIPFQLNSILALLKDRLVPLVIAGMIGPAGVTYLTWGQNIAFLSLEVMNNIIRITFPAYSRLQEDEESLKKFLEKNLFITALLLYPLLFGLMAIVPFLIKYIVTDKMEPALVTFYLYAVVAFWAPLSTTFTNVFNALGKIKITLKLMIMWTTLTWALSPILTYYYGYTGAAIASAAISFTSVIPIIIVKRMLKISILKSVWKPICASIVMSVLTYVYSALFVKDAFSLFSAILFGTAVYIIIMLILAKKQVRESFLNILNRRFS